MRGNAILAAAALFAVIAGSTVLYNGLKDKVQTPETLAAPNVRPEQSAPTEQPEQSDAGQDTKADEDEARQDTEADKRIKAPDFTVTDIEGDSVKLSDMLGKPVVLNFWASWCPPCKSEMPDFNKVYEELGEEVQFMMVNATDGLRETKEKGAAYISEEGFGFPVYYDTEQNAVTQYGIRAYPTTIFIDSEGYAVTGAEGAIDDRTLRKGIEMIAGTEDNTEDSGNVP